MPREGRIDASVTALRGVRDLTRDTYIRAHPPQTEAAGPPCATDCFFDRGQPLVLRERPCDPICRPRLVCEVPIHRFLAACLKGPCRQRKWFHDKVHTPSRSTRKRVQPCRGDTGRHQLSTADAAGYRAVGLRSVSEGRHFKEYCTQPERHPAPRRAVAAGSPEATARGERAPAERSDSHRSFRGGAVGACPFRQAPTISSRSADTRLPARTADQGSGLTK